MPVPGEPITVYLTRRRPCWLCSRSLATVTTGQHKGQYSALQVTIDGHERDVHHQCWHGRDFLDLDAEFREESNP